MRINQVQIARYGIEAYFCNEMHIRCYEKTVDEWKLYREAHKN